MTQLMSFKQKLEQKRAILVPGAPNALAARVITDLGFEAIYVTGAGVTNTSLGLPDLSFVDLTQIVQRTMAIRRRSPEAHDRDAVGPAQAISDAIAGLFLRRSSRTIRR
jgi:2-methylisocitrate lyase-like PEP mutase family enzyme